MLWSTVILWAVVAVCGGWYAGYMEHEWLRPEIQKAGWYKTVALAGFLFGLVLVPLAAWGYSKSGVVVLASLGGYVGLAFVVTAITARSLRAPLDKSSANQSIRSVTPSLAKIEEVGDELKAKLLSAFVTLDQSWDEVWSPSGRGTTTSNQPEERQMHLLASLVTLGEIAILASDATTKLPPVSAWNQSGLATDIIQLIRYAADKSSKSNESMPDEIVAAARLDPERLEARIRDCYVWVQTYSSTRSSVADAVLLEGLLEYLVRPLADAKLAERWYGDREVKIQVTRHVAQKSWASIVSRLRQLRGR